MERRVLDLSGESRHLRRERGFLIVEGGDADADHSVRVPFDDIEAVIVHARSASYSNAALLALSDAGIPLILCDQAHRPQAWMWPVRGHFEQSLRMRAQLALKDGQARRLCGRGLSKQRSKRKPQSWNGTGHQERRWSLWPGVSAPAIQTIWRHKRRNATGVR